MILYIHIILSFCTNIIYIYDILIFMCKQIIKYTGTLKKVNKNYILLNIMGIPSINVITMDLKLKLLYPNLVMFHFNQVMLLLIPMQNVSLYQLKGMKTYMVHCFHTNWMVRMKKY